MGLDPSALTRKDAVLAEADYSMPNVPETYATGVEKALENRPELARIRERLVKSRMGLTSAKAAYLPRLDFMAKYFLDDPNLDYNLDRENWTAALVLNWDLFTGFSSTARIHHAEAVVRELLAADRQTVLRVKLDVKRACLNLEDAAARWQVAKQGVKSAEESFRMVRQHYQGGAATITRFLEAELDLNRARVQSTAAYYDKIKARAEMARSVGFWAEEKSIP
jgi:outer membrane protein